MRDRENREKNREKKNYYYLVEGRLFGLRPWRCLCFGLSHTTYKCVRRLTIEQSRHILRSAETTLIFFLVFLSNYFFVRFFTKKSTNDNIEEVETNHMIFEIEKKIAVYFFFRRSEFLS